MKLGMEFGKFWSFDFWADPRISLASLHKFSRSSLFLSLQMHSNESAEAE